MGRWSGRPEVQRSSTTSRMVTCTQRRSISTRRLFSITEAWGVAIGWTSVSRRCINCIKPHSMQKPSTRHSILLPNSPQTPSPSKTQASPSTARPRTVQNNSHQTDQLTAAHREASLAVSSPSWSGGRRDARGSESELDGVLATSSTGLLGDCDCFRRIRLRSSRDWTLEFSHTSGRD